jgi:type II secretory pathway predicted ATPase ExeA
MDSERSQLGDRAFGRDADTLVTVKYQAQVEALKFLTGLLRNQECIGLVHGPEGSGKSTVTQLLGPLLARETAVALVDGTRLKPREFLTLALTQFGYRTELESTDELLKMVNVFAMQQTRNSEPPVLIIDNADRMFPSALKTLNALAGLEVQGRFVLRILLTGRSQRTLGISGRKVLSFELQPMTSNESLVYLQSRLRACGVVHPDTVMPIDVADSVYERSSGWPGLVNRHAMDALAPQPPRLVITRNSKTLAEYTFTDKKVLIGRSDFADIILHDDFASKLHAVLILYRDALVLVDLNSANGTTVNSTTKKSTILKDNDIISIGNHRLKVENAPAISPEMTRVLREQDTVKMKNLVDLRKVEARRRQLKAVRASEN